MEGGEEKRKEIERELSEKGGLAISTSYVMRWVEMIGIILVPVCLQVYLDV